MCCKNDFLLNPALYSPVVLSPVFSLPPLVDQSMFENSIAQQQSPQTSRPGQNSARRATTSANPNLGSGSVDSPSSGGQQRLKNAINLGKAVGAKVSAEQVLSSARPHAIHSSNSEHLSHGVSFITLLLLKWSSFLYLLKKYLSFFLLSFPPSVHLSLSFLFFCLFLYSGLLSVFTMYFLLSFFLSFFYLFLLFIFLSSFHPSFPPSIFFNPSVIPVLCFSVFLPSFLPSLRSMTC